ncbi:MAG: outer membrane beta-barrel protein [Chlamydiales bacterium]|nr:outer membrane beta-barrel protein [Chlamydiales bacterium]
MKNVLFTLGIAAASLFSSIASAQYLDDSSSCNSWYLFGGVVHTGLFQDGYDATRSSIILGDNDRVNNLGWQVFLGYKFIPCFGLELGYVDLAKQRTGEHIPDDADFNVVTGHYRDYVVPLRGSLSMHFCDLSLSALFGVHYYNSHGSLSSVNGVTVISRFKSGMDFNFGAAIEYKFIEWLGLRLDLSRYYIKHYDDQASDYTDALTANLVTYF